VLSVNCLSERRQKETFGIPDETAIEMVTLRETATYRDARLFCHAGPPSRDACERELSAAAGVVLLQRTNQYSLDRQDETAM